MRLTPLAKESVTQPKDLDRAGQDGGVLGRTIALLRQQGRDLLVGLALLGELEDLFFHLRGTGQPSERAHRHGHRGRCSFTTSPDNADLESIWSRAVGDHLVDQAAEEGFLRRRRQAALSPQFRDLPAGLEKGFPLLGAEGLGGLRSLRLLLRFTSS